MTARENIIDALEGKTPEKTPLTIYDWNMGAVTPDELEKKMNEPAWRRLLDMGLSVRAHCPVVKAVEHGVEVSVQEARAGGSVYRTEIKKTPMGNIRRVTRDGWHHEDWLKTPEDYRIMRWIVEHTALVPQYDTFEQAEAVVGDQGVAILTGAGNWRHRTPLMTINIDLAGTKQFCLDLAMELPELFDLYASLKQLFLREQQLIAEGPGRYVAWYENLTISMIGPAWYRDLMIPVYEEAVPIHAAQDKRVMVHYDGALKAIADQIADAPFAMIDSITEPPEGDMTYEVCRSLWPDLVLWANINIELYHRPALELRNAVMDKRRRAGKRGFAFEISEDLPRNWEQSIPVVLEVLDMPD